MQCSEFGGHSGVDEPTMWVIGKTPMISGAVYKKIECNGLHCESVYSIDLAGTSRKSGADGFMHCPIQATIQLMMALSPDIQRDVIAQILKRAGVSDLYIQFARKRLLPLMVKKGSTSQKQLRNLLSDERVKTARVASFFGCDVGHLVANEAAYKAWVREASEDPQGINAKELAFFHGWSDDRLAREMSGRREMSGE
jgi:hypothetical protein